MAESVQLGEDGRLYQADGGGEVMPPTLGWVGSDHGFLSWAYDPYLAAVGLTATNGTVFIVGVPIRVPTRITKVWWGQQAAATTATAGQNFAGLYSPAGTRLATTGVDSDTESTGLKSAPVGNIDVAPPFVWVGLVFNASAAGSIFRIAGINAAVVNANRGAAIARSATAGTSQTSLPSSITPASNTLSGSSVWAAVS